MATTAICYSFKQELLEAGHCFSANQTGVSCTNTSGSPSLSGIASTAGISLGMPITGTGIPANTVVAAISSSASIQMSVSSTANVSSFSVFGDSFLFALIKVSPSLTYSGTQTAYGTGSGTPTTANLGTDEASGTGYTAGGIALTNVTPSLQSTSTAVATFSPSPSLTSATISTTAALVYNSTKRVGAAANVNAGRAVGVYDFGGTQTVTNGTITFTMPAVTATTALIQLA